MFNNFKNFNKGRIRVKVIATMLAIILTLANFTLLGTYLNRVNATEIDLSNQDNKTNNENVKFEVYLDANDRGIKEKTADINSSEEKLYISASVQGTGTLRNAKIELLNTNFSLKNNQAITNIGIGTIEAEKGLNAALEITAKKQDKYNLALLNMVSEIKLTGEYIDGSGKVTDIDVVKSVKIEWTTNEIKGEDIELSQEVITNKIYNINGADKRVVQLLVTTSLKDNKAPIKTSTIEIPNPETGINPEEVKVASYGTESTNGKSSIEFADGENSAWEYNEEEEKTYITVNNNIVEEDNTVSWVKNSQDKYVVTYIYGETEEITSPSISNVKNTMEIYGRSGGIEKSISIELGKLEEIGDVVTLENSITNNIYKGKMYIGEETEYKTKENIYVPYSQLASKITLESQADQTNIEGEANTYYKETIINKAEALKVLGTEGTITIYNAENKTVPLKEIKLSEETEEENYVVEYEGTVRSIVIETSKAVSEGIIEITNTKAIKIDNLDNIKEIQTLTNTSNIIVANEEETAIVNTNKTKTANFVEPTTSFDISIDKTTLTSQAENNVKITAELKALDESNKLFKNPVIQIEMPKEITEVSLGEVSLLYEDELSIVRKEVKTNEAGNKVIEIELQGEQTKYNENSAQGGANIVIEANLKTEKFMASKNVEIKATCINDAETVERTKTLEIKSREGLVTRSVITAGENSVQEINKNTINIEANNGEEITVKTDIINNYGDKINGTNIIGKVSEGTTLTGAVAEVEGATIYYSEEESPAVDSESWKTNVTNFNNIKSFKIELLEGMENAQTLTVQYIAKILEDASTASNTLTLSGTIAEEQIENTIKYNVILPGAEIPEEPGEPGEEVVNNALRINMEVTAGGEDIKDQKEVNNGQVIRYKVTVTNISDETLNNVNLTATIENGVFYDLVQCGVIEDDTVDENGDFINPDGTPVYTYDEDESLKAKDKQVEKLEPGESANLEYQVVAYIGEGENANKFNNNIVISADNIEPVKATDSKTIKEASLGLKLKYGYNEEVNVYSNSTMNLIIEATNLTDSQLQNVNVKMNLPEGLDCNVDEQSFVQDVEGITLTKNGRQINLLFEKIEANTTASVTVELITDEMPVSETERSITLKLNGTVNNDENEYISNDYTKTILQRNTDIIATLTSDKMNKTLKEGDEITYTAIITNNGYIDVKNVNIIDSIQEELQVLSAKVINSDGEEKDILADSNNLILINEDINVQESIKIVIKAKVNEIFSNATTITNSMEIIVNEDNVFETEKLVNMLDNPNADNQEDNKDPNSVSGLAWIDENKDGIRDNQEQILQGVRVILLDSKGNLVKETETSLTGTYKFTDLEHGDYLVVFEYDTSKYVVTKYQASGATNSTNSDAISKQIQIGGDQILVGVTDIIKIDGSTTNENIDIGLIENAKFDLSLNKYISKVVLSNSKGTTTYEYDDTNFTKVEISARRLAGTVLLVEYELQITNEGDVDGYVTDLLDYLPEGMVFTSETNPDWYMDGSGILHNESIAEEAIKPGESKSVTLVLTRTLQSNSTGVIDNIAEIGESTNLEGIAEYDSTGGNNQAGEDDISIASLLVSIATGSPIMYIGIAIASMLVLGAGIYLINKKVLRVRI